jgi:hypothetical protein
MATTTPATRETARWSTITQTCEGTNQIQRMVMARQLLKQAGGRRPLPLPGAPADSGRP